MRRSLVLLAGLAGLSMLASASSVLPALGTPPPVSIGCVSAAASFSGQAYCLDGNHFPLLSATIAYGPGVAASGQTREQENQMVGLLELDGWRTPTRCEGNGTAGKREQLVYVHVQGQPDIFATARTMLLQQVIPGANGVFEHTTAGKRAIRWVTRQTTTGCIPSIARVTVPAADNTVGAAFTTISSDVLAAMGGGNANRSYLVFVDEDEGDCGLGEVRRDDSPGATNVNNTGGAVAMVWPECWTGLTAAHELTHTLGAVQPEAPHHTDLGHCWDGRDAMCYADGSPQQQQLICTGPDDYRKLDCNGDDYFALYPKPGSYLTDHWNSASSQFLIDSRPRLLPTQPGAPTGVTVTPVDDGHVQVSWTAGVTTRGPLSSWTVLVGAQGGEILGDANGLWPYIRSIRQVKVPASAGSVVIAVRSLTQTFAVYATNASGDGQVSAIVSATAA